MVAIQKLLCDRVWCKNVPGQHSQSLGCFSDTQGVLIQHINWRNEEASPRHVISVEVTVGDGAEQVIVLSGQSSAADGNSQLIHKFLQGVDIDLQKRPVQQQSFNKEHIVQDHDMRVHWDAVTLILFLGL